MKKIIVYTLTDPIDLLVKYIGVTSRPKRRFREHIADMNSTLKCTWIKKLKLLGLSPIYDEIDETDTENFKLIEQYWISQFKTWGFPLKNMTDGGEGSYGVIPWNKGLNGCYKHTDKAKEQMSLSRKGKNPYEMSDLTKKKLSDIKKGSKWSDEQRIKFKISISKKVYCFSLNGEFKKEYEAIVDVVNDNFDATSVSRVCNGIYLKHKGHIFSFDRFIDIEKYKSKRKAWNKGITGYYKHSCEIKEKMSLSRKGKTINTNNKEGNNPNSKIVYLYDLEFNLIKKYDFIRGVVEDGFNYDMVRKRCKNNSLKPYKGFIFTNKLLNG